MIDAGLVLDILLAEAALAVAAFVALLAHGLTVALLAERREQRALRAGALLVSSLETPAGDVAAVEALRRLPTRRRVDVLASTAHDLSGHGRTRLESIAGQSDALRGAARLTRSRRWRSRLEGARLFTVLGGGRAHVRPLLRDRRSEVLAQAIEWSADHPAEDVVARLLDLLVSGDALARYAVRDSLGRMGAAAAHPLEERLRVASGAEAATLLSVAVALATPAMLPAAARLIDDAQPATRVGAAALLGALGGAEAVTALEAHLADEEPAVRAAAARALGRLMAWPSGSAIAGLLADPAWDVRQAAALALRAFGSPGLLLLRRALEHEDRFARDAARQVLDLPGSVEPFLP